MLARYHPWALALDVVTLAIIVHGKTLDDDWAALNASVGGRLFAAEPLARPCFSVYNGQPVAPDTARCSFIQENYLNASFRTNLYQGVIHSYNEICASNVTDQCLLNIQDTAPAQLPTGSCNIGVVSDRYITVMAAHDVQAALNFSRGTGVRLSVKATGHDYASRSSLKGSLALWTRELRDMSYHESFVPVGCRYTTTPVRAMTVGAGANLGEVYAFADLHNVTFIGGSSHTVAAAGGFTLMGGHGMLTPLYGECIST